MSTTDGDMDLPPAEAIVGHVVDGDLIIYDDSESGERHCWYMSDCHVDCEEAI